MKTFSITLLATLLLICSAITIIASPAYPGLITVKQPDGTTISYYLKGDEKVHWMESEDGYTLMYNAQKYVVYAQTNGQGNLAPSNIKFTSSNVTPAANIAKGLRYSEAQVNTLMQIWKMTNDATVQRASSTGIINTLCALAAFKDKPFTHTVAEFDALMNQSGYNVGGSKGSVRDYYYENSYGLLTMHVDVVGPVTVSQNAAYYGTSSQYGDATEERYKVFAREVIDLIDSIVDFSGYAINGTVENFHIIFAGYGDESVGNGMQIWAHEWALDKSVTKDGVRLFKYSCSPELRGSSGTNITHIGVVCHEMGHTLGSPDFYDTLHPANSPGVFTGTGVWDLMGSGNWNNSGACPAHINMYEKIQLGWVTPVTIKSAQAISDMPNSAIPNSKNPIAYQNNTSTIGEYFIFENRQQIGFDSYVPGHGLIIYHVSLTDADISNNTVNTGSQQKMYPVCASATSNPNGTPASYGNINSAGCPYPGSSNNTSFTDYTIPAATSWKGANTQKPVTEIQELNKTISFNFMMPDATPITNLKTTVLGQSVKLAWTKPEDNTTIGYNIYRNDALLIKLTGNDNTSYTQYNVNSGTYNYCVTALYAGKESSPVCKSVTINNSSAGGSNYLTVQNLTAKNVNGNKDVQLSWQSPFVNDWMTFADSWAYNVYLNNTITQFSAVVRFTTDDLQKFQGSSLTKVRLGIVNLQCKYIVQAWYANPDTVQAWLSGKDVLSLTGDPIVNQTITNPSKAGNDFILTLDSPIPVAPNKELWIGIQYTLSPITYVAGSDAGPIVAFRNLIYYGGNWSMLGSGWYNWYIAGYMDFGGSVLKAPADSWLRASNAATTTGSYYVVYRDNQQIATPTQSPYTDANVPAGSHIYCVSIKYSDGKESEQTCIQAVPSDNTAIVSVNPDDEVNIYPNPVQRGENLTIHCDPQTSATFSLYSISGQLIQQEQVIGPDVQKKMDFSPGIYILQINSNTKTFIRKIIIK